MENKKILISLLVGMLLPLSFAPFGLWWLAPILLSGLLWCWFDAKPKDTFFSGWVFGVGFFLTGVSWVFISIHRFGNANIFLSALLTFLLIAVLAIFFAVQGLVFGFVSSKTRLILHQASFRGLTAESSDHNSLFLDPAIKSRDDEYNMSRDDELNKSQNDKYAISICLFIFPITWIFFEWLRSWVFTGFPWLLIGYSQTNSPLKGFAPIVGCLGISFLVALTAGLLFLIFTRRDSTYRTARCAVPTVCILLIWIGGYFLRQKQWTHPTGKEIQVSLVQGNIPQSIKWDPSQVLPTLMKYQLLTESHLDSHLIVWPEAAVPILKTEADEYLYYLSKKANTYKTTIILGIPIMENDLYYNAAIAIGNGNGVYYKRRLVPFGEFIPFEKYLRGLIQLFNLPMSDFSKGPMEQPLLTANGIKIAPFICYEIAYSSLLKNDLPDAEILLVLSDDAWFGDSIAEPQHLQIAEMRALESGRYVLMSTNNGITAIIKPNGEVQGSIPQFKTDVLTGKIFAMQGKTPWVRY